MIYNNKEVWTEDNFSYESAQVGDYVEQSIVDNVIDCLPPACMTPTCVQMGEPYGHREDPNTGKWRATYTTFKKVCDNPSVWMYCGHCFYGESSSTYNA